MRKILVAFVLLAPLASLAQTAYVTDQFEVTLRSGPSTQNSILRVINSGVALEVLESDQETGYSRVQTQSGVEGWVLSRYLMNDAAARDQLAGMRQQVGRLRGQIQDLTAQLEQSSASGDELSQERGALQTRNQALETELEDIRQISAGAIDLNNQNEELQQRVQTLNHQVQAMTAENQDLGSRRNRDWFVAGAGVLLVGIVLGLVVPRLRLRRKSSWSDF